MSYIIVRTSLNPAARIPGEYQSFDAVTHVECEQETSQVQAAMASLSGAAARIGCSSQCCFRITMPPSVVLNRLRSHAGYKVVAANSIGNATSGHWQIWTLSNN